MLLQDPVNPLRHLFFCRARKGYRFSWQFCSSSFWRDALVRAERRSLRGCARGSDGDGDTRLRKTLEAFLLVVWSPIVIFQ
jgi:hypothetical protein